MAMVRFEDVATRVNTREDRFNTALTYYVGGDHIETGELKVAGRGVIREADLGPMFYFGFKPGDILFVTRNPHLRKCAMVDFPGICSEKTLVIATKDENVLSQKYLAAVMQSDDFWEFMEENKSGSVNYFVNWSTLADYEFDLPPIERQHKLADLLWAANDLKEAYKKAIFATDEMLKAKFNEMFGDGKINGGGHNDVKLSTVAKIVLGSTPKSSNPAFWDGDCKWITPAELSDEQIEVWDTVRHITREGANSAHLELMPKGTVLLSTRAPIGKTAIVMAPMYCNQGFKNFICSDSLHPRFLLYVLRMNKAYLQSLGTGSTFMELSKRVVENLTIPLPCLPLQREFVSIAEKAEVAKTALKITTADLDQVMKGLING